jgi:pyrroline-5-carboxylate reductase
MTTATRIAFVGGGNMARALIAALRQAGYPLQDIVVGEPSAAQRELLSSELGVTAVADNAVAVRGAGIVVLAVKPQDMASVVAPLRTDFAASRPVVLSVAAGLRVADLAELCGPGTRIVRAMPNRPAFVGAGATGLYAGPGVDAADRAHCEQVLGAAGRIVWIDDESLMDAVTAVSGSGPAYFFLLAEALAEAGMAQGLPAAAARQLAAATLHGAGMMAAADDVDLARLRAEVTSRGGTTEAALRALVSAGFQAAVAAAVEAATERGRELSRQFGRPGT